MIFDHIVRSIMPTSATTERLQHHFIIQV